MQQPIKVGINGFGRIGRNALRVFLSRPDIQVVGINDLADSRTMAHLFKYDSIHGTFKGDVQEVEGALQINGVKIPMCHAAEPSDIPWETFQADVVLEATGKFKTELEARKHLEAGAKKVIISAVPSDSTVKTVVMGINDHILEADDEVVSNASCTTNSAAPLVKILEDEWGIESAYITTVHSYTTDQSLHDSPHRDLRRARSAAVSIVPTTTGAAKAITKVFPELDGKIGGCGIRVPVPDGSLTDLTCIVKKDTSEEEVNRIFQNYATGAMQGILYYTEEPIVSIDIIDNPYSSVFDAGLTSVIGRMVKVVGWYDNEIGYSHRLADLIQKLFSL